MPRIEGGYVYPMEAPGLGIDLLPAFFERPDLSVRRSSL
jgi:galactonate dehydratase